MKIINNFRKLRIFAASLALAVCSAALVCGCGGHHEDYSGKEEVFSAAYANDGIAQVSDSAGFSMKSAANEISDYEMPEEASAGTMGGDAQAAEELKNAAEAESSRKLIRNISVDIQTETMDQLMSDIQKKVSEYGGYVESSNIYGSDYYGNGGRSASYTVRIPADSLDAFMDSAFTAGKITSRSENVQDITLQYTDLESKVTSLKVEQERLLELMETAENVDAVIALESRLSEIRYELENIQSSLKVYDNQVTYSTVSIYLSEVETITPGERAGFAERLSGEFRSNLAELAASLEDFVIWFLISIPNFIVFIIGLAAACFILRILLRIICRIFKIKLPQIHLRKKTGKKEKVPEDHSESGDNSTNKE